MGSLFEEIGHHRDTFKDYIARFETALVTISKSHHSLALSVFNKGLLTASKSLEDHLSIDVLILHRDLSRC